MTLLSTPPRDGTLLKCALDDEQFSDVNNFFLHICSEISVWKLLHNTVFLISKFSIVFLRIVKRFPIIYVHTHTQGLNPGQGRQLTAHIGSSSP